MPTFSPDDPGPDSWGRVIRPGSQVRLYQRGQNGVGKGTQLGPVWQNGIRYWVDTPGDARGRASAGHRRSTPPTGFQFRLAGVEPLHRPGPRAPDRERLLTMQQQVPQPQNLVVAHFVAPLFVAVTSLIYYMLERLF